MLNMFLTENNPEIVDETAKQIRPLPKLYFLHVHSENHSH